MKLAELTEGMNVSLCEEIARFNGWHGQGERLAVLLGSPDAIGKLEGALYELERRTLTLIVQRFGCEPFEWAKLERAGYKLLSGAAMKVGLIRLIRRGIVFAVRRNWGEPDYIVPEEALPLWGRLLLPLDGAALGYVGPDVAADSPYRPAIAAHLLFVLSYLAREDVAVTQKGGMHKRHAGKLAAVVAVRDEELAAAGAGAKPLYGSAAADFLCMTAYKLGLLDKEGERIAVQSGKLDEWLARSESSMNAALYACWKEANRISESAVQHGEALLEQVPEESWVSLGKTAKQLIDAGVVPSDPKGTAEPRLAERLHERATALAAWGWAETGEAADGDKLFRWIRKPGAVQPDSEVLGAAGNAADLSPVSESESTGTRPALFVQPDFELIVLPDCSYPVRWELEMIAERVRHEHVAVYRITRETVLRALEQGRSAEGIALFLQRHAKYGLPENVREAIAQWGERHSQLRLVPAVVLKLRDEAAAKAIYADERLAALLEEQLGPTAWLVRSDKVEELRALLVRSGYSPGGRKPGTEASVKAELPAVEAASPVAVPGDATAMRGGGTAPAKGLIYSKATVQYYDSERKFPLIEDVYPGLQEIPPMWLKDCRTYHVSTRKQMIQKALEWKAGLRLRIAGADRDLIPLRLDGIREDWAVTCFGQAEEVRLLPDQWEEMQLILPGIND
ncbi:helicase-associated domain-containing protein [Paenibacillus hodogayensis]|uniref:Helicase-associated domain-containing protein n=1 Tax=Paenibacillus hodogayensis TaxID=279208 RepID=A0ABV5VP01_9BACL